MLYLGIDQHSRQITISLRDDHGDVLQARQVSTRPEKINDFFIVDCSRITLCHIRFLLENGDQAVLVTL